MKTTNNMSYVSHGASLGHDKSVDGIQPLGPSAENLMISEEGMNVASNSSIDLGANAKLRDAQRVTSNLFTEGSGNMAATYASLPTNQLDEA